MESQHQIKDRLYKTAAAMWDLPQGQTEQNFDPLVGLLFGACAMEFEKIGHDIETSRARTLEKIVQLLHPQVLTQALPASAIAHAMPIENHCLTHSSMQLYFDKRKASNNEYSTPQYQSIHFSPAGSYHLAAHSIAYWCSATAFYENVSPIQQRLLAGNGNETKKTNSIFIALQENTLLSEQLTFYFDIKSESFKEIFFDYLRDTKWFINGSPIKSENDFGPQVSMAQDFSPKQLVKGKTNTLLAIEKQVNQYYHKNFISLSFETAHLEKSCAVPQPVMEQYENNPLVAPLLNKEHVWLEVLFPEALDIALFQDNLLMQLNCFPVINKELIQQQYKVAEHLAIFPLHSDAYFLDIASATDNNGNDLLNKTTEDEEAAIHYTGVERYSNRAATAEINQLAQHLKDESVKFSHIGSDFLYDELKSLKQILSKLENKLSGSEVAKTETPFLLLKQAKEKRSSNVFVSFWTCDGAAANQIKAGTTLLAKKSIALKSNSTVLMSSTQGGRAPLQESEKVLAYKTAVLNKEKLVTTNDLILFCKMRMALPQMQIVIQQGYQKGNSATAGYSKTIDVCIHLNQQEHNKIKEQGDLAFWQKDLELAIKERSNFFMPIRILLKTIETN